MFSSSQKEKFPDLIFFDLYPFPMWIYDLETYRFLAVNKEAINHYGFTKEEFLGMTIKDIRPVAELPALETALLNQLCGTKSYKNRLFKHQKKDGSIIHVQIKSNLINFFGRRADIVTAIDLTEQHLQEKLIEEQKRYLAIIGELNQLLITFENWKEALNQCFQLVGETLDLDIIYFFQNDLQVRETSQKLMWSKEGDKLHVELPEFQNMLFSDFPLFIETLEKGLIFQAIIRELPPSITKNVFLEKKIRSTLVIPVMINNAFSGFIGLNDIVNERTWNKNEIELLKNLTSNIAHVIKESNAHKRLLNSEAKFKSLVQNGTDLISITSHEGIYKYVAPTSKTVLGIPPETFIGKNAYDFIYEEDIPKIKKRVSELETKNRITSKPYRIPDGDGKLRWVETVFTNHLLDPVIAGIVSNTRDITSEVEKKMGKELVASLTKAIDQPGTLTKCLTEALDKLVMLSSISLTEIWLVSEDKTRLDLISKSYQNKKFKIFNEDSKNINSLEKGIGLSGHVWESNKTQIWRDLPTNKNFVRSKSADLANLNSAIGIPIIYNDEFLGCFVCLSHYNQNYLSDHLKLLNEVGLQMGAVIKQKITEEEYKNFFDISPDSHCLLGFDGCIKKFNRSFKNLLGYKENEIINQPIINFIYKEDQSSFLENLGNNAQSINSHEARLVSKSGKIKWLRWTTTSNNEVKVIISVAKDITAQKTAERDLETAYERLKNAQKIAKLGYWSRDLISESSEWSEEVYKLFEFDTSEINLTQETMLKTVHPADRHIYENDLLKKLRPREIFGFEHRIITGSNKIKWVRQELQLITDANDNPCRIDGTVQDITQSKEQQEQLAFSNERFRLAMEASNEMMWDVDLKNQTIIRGKSYERSFQYPNSEAYAENNSWFRRIHPEDLPEVWDSLERSFKAKDLNSWNMEYRMLSKEGIISYFVDRCYIIRDELGVPIRAIGSALDVTASRQQLEQIKRQNKNFREIAWLQSHVIRAPLSRIMSIIHLTEINKEERCNDEIYIMMSDAAKELDEVIKKITKKINAIEDEDARNLIN